MNKKMKTILMVFVCSLLSFATINIFNASEIGTEKYPLTHYIKDETLATIISNRIDGIDSVTDTFSEDEFKSIAGDVTELVININEEGIKGKISNLDGLQYFTNLNSLSIYYLDDNITTLPESISSMKDLEQLTINYSNIASIDDLSSLEKLTSLSLSGNQISEIKGLENNLKLTTLDLSNNQISEIEGLSNNILLDTLYLSNNKITKIEGLGTNTLLRCLVLENNQISKIENLDANTKLEWLNLDDNKIEKIEGLNNNTALINLYLHDNKINKIEGLENNTSIVNINLSNNQISEIEGLSNNTSLQWLTLDSNKIEKIEGLDKNTDLTHISINDNQISKVEGLDNNNKLRVLYLASNKITDIGELDIYDDLLFIGLSDNQIIDLKGGLDEIEDGTIYLTLGNQQHTEYLPKSSKYDELFKVYNCPDDSTSDFDLTKLLINNEMQYVDKIDLSLLGDDNNYKIEYISNSGFPTTVDELSPYSVTITILSEEEINAEDTNDKVTQAATNEEELISKLHAKSYDYEGNENTDTIYISDSGEYDYENPEAGEYNIKLSFKNENDYVFSTTVKYTVEDDTLPTISSEDKTVELSNAPEDSEAILELLDVKVDGSSDLPSEGMEISYGGYDFTNPQAGVYEVSVTYNYYEDKTISTTSYLTVEDDTVELSKGEVKETGFNYGITAIVLLLILVIIILIVKKIKK